MTKRSLPKPADTRGQHGATQLPGLSIDSYNLAIHDPDGEGFLGDRASQTAFRDLLDKARKHRTRKDPFGKERSDEVGKKAIDLVLIGGDPDAAHLVHIAVEEYAQRLAQVVRCFLAQQAWEGVERIVLGGGLPESKAGGLAIRRSMQLLKQARAGVDLHVLQHDADEAGLLRPTQGTIEFDGGPVRRVPDGFGVVFQEYNRSLFPWLSVQRNVEFGLTELARHERAERATEALKRVGLSDVPDKYPWQLSGGMQQRVAIARALATHPRVLLMDEPFASVDAQTRINLELMTADISAELGLTTVLITHDIDEAIFLADRVVVLSARPSHVLTEVVVDLPRPRDELETKADPLFQEYRRTVHDLIVHHKPTITPATEEN